MGFGSAKDEEARSKLREQHVQDTRPWAAEARLLPGQTLSVRQGKRARFATGQSVKVRADVEFSHPLMFSRLQWVLIVGSGT